MYQKQIELTREFIETAKSAEELFRRLRSVAEIWQANFPKSVDGNIGRGIWFDGEHSIFLDAGRIGAKVSYLDGSFLPENTRTILCDMPLASENQGGADDRLQIILGLYDAQGEWYPCTDLSTICDVNDARRYLEFF